MVLHPKRMATLSLPIAHAQPTGEGPDVDIPGNILFRSSEVLVERANCFFDLLRLLHRQLQAQKTERPKLSERPAGRVDCNRSAMAGFAAAQGQATDACRL